MAAPSDTQDVFSSSGGGGSMLDLPALWHAFRKFYWIAAIGIFLGLVFSVVYLKLSKPVFRSTAEIKVERRVPTPLIGEGVPGAETTPEDLQTIVHSFINPELMTRVAGKLGLAHVDGFVSPSRLAKDTSMDEIVGFLMGNSNIALVPNTRLLDVSFTYREPKMAQKVANAIVEEGIEYDRDQRIKAADANITYLREEAEKLEASLRKSEEQLNAYTEKVGIVTIDQQIDLVSQEMKVLNTSYTEAKMARLKLESDFQEIEMYRGNVEKLGAIDSVRNIPIVLSLTQRVTELKGNIAKLENRYRAENPFMVQAKTELREVERNLAQEILSASSSVEAMMSAARRNEENLAYVLAEQEQKVVKVRELSIQSRVLDRQIAANRMAYEAALQRLNQELSQARSMPVLLQVVEPANPAIMIAVNRTRMLAGGVFGGLLAGLGVIVLLAQLDKSIKSSGEAERILGLQVLAEVPRFSSLDDEEGAIPRPRPFKGKPETCPVFDDPGSETAEAFRTLRTAIQTISERPAKTILVTGCSALAGTSFCSLNLASALAQTAQRTLLVDANLRNPTLEEWIFSSRGRYGLSDFLMNDVALSSILHQTVISHLDVVTAGGTFPNVAEILSRSRFRDFCEAVRPLYDRIIFDSASLSHVSDTLSFARDCEAVCLVVAVNQTTRDQARHSTDLLERAGVTPTGVIVNFSPVAPSKNLLSVLESSPTEAVALKGTDDFPVSCPACGIVYESLHDYLEKSSAPGGKWNIKDQQEMLATGKRIVRECPCGTLLVLPPTRRRDNSRPGIRRRELFADLLDHLSRAGVDRKEARAKLLLTLKIWRTELNASGLDENSAVGTHRRKLFDEMQEMIVRSGLSSEDAKAKLLETIEAWQDAP